jgi:hypothetical protein
VVAVGPGKRATTSMSAKRPRLAPARGILGPPKFVQFGAPIIVAARRFPPAWSVIYY